MAVSSNQFSRTRRSSSPFAQPYTSPFGFNNPMGRSYKSGRGYWDPERMDERYARASLKYAEGRAGGGGGGSRGGGGYGGGGQPPMPLLNDQPLFGPADLGDLQSINFGNAPSLGQDYAGALSRTQLGLGGVGDYQLMQQRTNPSQSSNYNDAIARMKFRRFALMRKGLLGAAQQALIT